VLGRNQAHWSGWLQTQEPTDVTGASDASVNNSVTLQRGHFRCAVWNSNNPASWKPRDSFTRMADGTSNQIIVGEKRLFQVMQNQAGGLINGTIGDSRQGDKWADSYEASTCNMFYTILPPNSPSCYYTGTGDPSQKVITSASSYHSGGTNVVLADGAVRFVSETIEATPPTSTQIGYSLSGASPYGVWGALGSRNGSENKSL
jgi:prepilin-type processing-associated H-X9-DG protein